MSKDVEKVSPVVQTMLTDSKPVRDLTTGGDHMRSLKEDHLPKFPKEDKKDYDARVKSSWLFDATGKTIEDMVGKVFDKPVKMKVADQASLEDWVTNIDLEGRDLSNFAKDVFAAALRDGMSWIMVDAPMRSPNATKADVIASNWRPYMTCLKLTDVLGWKWENINNVPTIVQLRIMESVPKEDAGEFNHDTVDQVRVLRTIEGFVAVEIYRKREGKGWELHDSHQTGQTEIMVAPVYTNRTGFWQSKTPLTSLAEINLAHWRSQSDQANIMHHARAPMKYFHGYTEDEIKKLAEGAGYAFYSSNYQASVGVVEHNGAAIEAGAKELKEMEFQMQTMGLQLMITKTGNNSATGDAIDESKSNSRLAMFADDLKDALEIAIVWMGDVSGNDFETDVVVNKDFAATMFAHLDMVAVDKMYVSGVISKETYINESVRRGLLSEDVTPDDEAERVEDEGEDDPPMTGDE